jgi:hypothetical protein
MKRLCLKRWHLAPELQGVWGSSQAKVEDTRGDVHTEGPVRAMTSKCIFFQVQWKVLAIV